MTKRLGSCLLLLFACSGIQTKPTCQVGGFGLITFYNNSDEYRDVTLWRVRETPNAADRFERSGVFQQKRLQPLTVTTMRALPGVVLVEVQYVAGRVWFKLLRIEVCDDNTIKMRNPILS